MTELEKKLSAWTGPSSLTEKAKQDTTERMIRDAIGRHSPLEGVRLKVYAKGSYRNNTNVRSDSDVNIAVECMKRSTGTREPPDHVAVSACTPARGRPRSCGPR